MKAKESQSRQRVQESKGGRREGERHEEEQCGAGM